MTLNANAKIQNVKASIEKYIQAKLVGTEDLKVDFEGIPFEVASEEEWVQERIIGFADRSYHRQVSATTDGQTTEIMLSLNVFVDPAKTNKTNRHYEIRDALFEYFEIGTEIDLYDFSGGDFTNSLQKMQVREIITDRPIPNDDYWQYNFTIGIDWLENW